MSAWPEAYQAPHQLQGPSKGRGAEWYALRHSASAAAWRSARPGMICPSSSEAPTHQSDPPSVSPQCFQFTLVQDGRSCVDCFGEVKWLCPRGCPRSAFNDVAICDCQKCFSSRPYRDAQDRLLWRDKTWILHVLAHLELRSNSAISIMVGSIHCKRCPCWTSQPLQQYRGCKESSLFVILLVWSNMHAHGLVKHACTWSGQTCMHMVLRWQQDDTVRS